MSGVRRRVQIDREEDGLQICRKCGTRLTVIEEGQQYHPYCTPEHQKLPGAPMTLYESVLREDLIEIIQWTSDSSPRSLQVTLGCSEAGSACDRKIAYRIAGKPKINFPDPLKALMGTAFHHLLDINTVEFQRVNGISEWLTETEVWPAQFLKGHVDLYSTKRKLVLDWKTSSADMIKKWQVDGIPDNYKTQIMLYGKGMVNAGHEVQRVGLAAVPRGGTLRDILVLTVAYDPEYANDALTRV